MKKKPQKINKQKKPAIKITQAEKQKKSEQLQTPTKKSKLKKINPSKTSLKKISSLKTNPSLGIHPSLGVLCALGVALSLGISPSLTKKAYTDGASFLFVIFCRGLFPIFCLFIFTQIIKKPLNIDKIPLKAIIMICLAIPTTAIAYLSSIIFISPNFAVVILYLFPIMALVIVAIQNQKIPTFFTLLAYFCALGSLVLVIGPAFGNIDFRGVILAFIAAIGSTGLLFVGHVAGAKVKAYSLVFIGSVALSVIAGISMLLFDLFIPPQTYIGWQYLSFSIALYMIGYLLIVLSTSYLRPDLASLVMNIEPLVGVITVYFVLGDALSWWQFFGVITLIIAISVGGILAHRESLEPEDLIILEHS